MAVSAIARSFEVDPSKISFSSQVKTLDSGYKMVWCTYKNEPFAMQLPKMKAPFGLNKWTDDKGSAEKYSIDLSFAGKETNEKLQATYDLFNTLDKKIIQVALENSQEWFKKKYTTEEVIEALYTPIVKMPKNEQYPPTIKLPLKEKPDGNFTCLVFDGQRNQVNLKTLECKGSEIHAIVQLSHVWIAGGKFGVAWKVQQLQVSPRPALTEYAFQPEDDEQQLANDISAVDDDLNDDDLRFA